MNNRPLKTALFALAIGSAMAFLSCKSASKATGGNNKSIVILYENDVHCSIDGYAKIAGLRNAVADTAYVAVVSCGDFLQGGTAGAVSKGQYVVDIMRSVGYDAITLGNHEFDYKTPRMFDLLSYIKAPITCINLRSMSNGEFPFAPYVIKTMGNRKVAFIGITTPTSIATEEYAFFDEAGNQLFELCPKTVYQLVQNAVDEARKKGATYVVALSHLGEDKTDVDVDSHGLIHNTTGIDVVLDAHTHSVIPSDTVHNRVGQPVVITETGTKFANIGKLLITTDGHATTQLIPTSDVTSVDPAVVHITDSIKSLVKNETSAKVCDSEVKLTILDKNGKQEVRMAETNVGDLVADSYLALTDADFAMTNGGGIRSDLPAGTLCYGDIISLLPYNNYICTVEITGVQLKKLLDACTQSVPHENGDFPQVSGLKFTINPGGKGVTDVMVRNKQNGEYEPLNPDHTYQLATIDYCVIGGGFYGMLKQNKVLQQTGINYSDCLIQYLKNNLSGKVGKEYAAPQGRITIKQ